MSTQIILRNDKTLAVSIDPRAYETRDQALLSAAFVVRVNDAPTQEKAVAAQTQLHELLSLVEKDRKAVKEPVLEYGRSIDTAAKEFCADLKAEQLRLAVLVGNFQEQENARARAAQQAENERLTIIERERAAELAKTKTLEEMDRVQERFELRVRQEAPPPVAPVRAEGQRVTSDWDVHVNDPWLLARAHPTCVNIEPRKSEIKALLNAGVKVAGVTATRKIVSTVSTRYEKPHQI